MRQCDETMYRCPESGRCIPKLWLCDSDRDCDYGEDELNCSSYRVCAENMYECGSHECIEDQYYCDGSTQCIDGSDEPAGCDDEPTTKNTSKCKGDDCITLSANCSAPDFFKCGKNQIPYFCFCFCFLL